MRFTLTNVLRQSYLCTAYILGLTGALWLAFQLRFDFAVPPEYFHNWWIIFGGVVGIKLLFLLLFGQFGSLLSYFGFHDLGKLLAVTTIAASCALVAWWIGGVVYAPPRAVIVTDFLISFLFLCGFRMSLRLIREGYFDRLQTNGRKRVVVIGAGDVGASLVRDFQVRRGLGVAPRAFFDDDSEKWGTSIHGITVEGPPETLAAYCARHRVDEVIIAMPSAPGRRLRAIVDLLNRLHLRFEIVPSYEQMLTGKVRVSQVRPVEIQDLLGREPVDLEDDKIRHLVCQHTLMVTGAGGTIGGELCRQIAAHNPLRLLLVERSEFLLFQIEQELRELGYGAEIVPLVADIRDSERMAAIMARFSPSIIFHAAAHKHVPMMEAQPFEAFLNNTIGTRDLATLAARHRVERFVLISTDKAINPTNAMGATKRLAELFLQAYQGSCGATKFMAVRFGNVLGSTGSVVPTFKRQIAAGGPVTVTHPDITRYFMTVNEAVGLVLQSATLGQGGEIFVLDMGSPMKIADLAKQLIELSGLVPGADIEIKFTGLRPGEKLYEELNHSSENHAATTHTRIMRFTGPSVSLPTLTTALDRLVANGGRMDSNDLKLEIKTLVPEYTPHLTSS